MSKDRFLFFENFKRIADTLPDDLRLKFYDAMTDYALYGIETEDPIIKSLIVAISPSLDKEEKRGGNHNPLGQNQHNKDKPQKDNIKIGQNNKALGQKEVKVGQSGQSFLETETRNGNKKQEDTILPSEDKSSSVSMVVKTPSHFDLSALNAVFEKYGLPQVAKLNDERKTKLRQRIAEVENFENFVGEVEKALAASSFLRGDNGRGWRADFDFFLQKSKWQKVLEGCYQDQIAKNDDEFWRKLEAM